MTPSLFNTYRPLHCLCSIRQTLRISVRYTVRFVWRPSAQVAEDLGHLLGIRGVQLHERIAGQGDDDQVRAGVAVGADALGDVLRTANDRPGVLRSGVRVV